MNALRKLMAHLAGGLGTVGVAFFFLVFSCSQKLPTAPQGQPAVLKSAAVEKPSGGLTKKQSGDYLEAPDELAEEPEADTVTFEPDSLDYTAVDAGESVEKSVGLAGYTIKFPIGTKDTALLIVPDGALAQNWNLSLRANLVPTRDEKMSVAIYDFFPDGLVYLKDCYLVQPTRFPDGTFLVLSWFNPLSGKWEEESVARVQGGKAVFVIRHFSTYGAPYDGDGLGSGGQ
ncbi:MAG TPA: hypothetical protein VI546_06090 [candidate division Zixibacteria bacterium]|nr:hypothetical protein [candidate division Zixibacteria bacterium]